MNKNYVFALLLACGFSQAQVINFPDPVFKARLLEADVTNDIAQGATNNNIKIDANNNGEIEQNEALLVYSLFYASGPPIRPTAETTVQQSSRSTALVDMITDVTGISYFTNLRKLDLSDNMIVTVDLQALTSLQMLTCQNSSIQSLNLNGVSALAYLNCMENQLTELSLPNQPLLQTIYCAFNQLTELSVAGITHLQYLSCTNNLLESLEFGGNTSLNYVFCGYNQFTEIDLDGGTAQVLHCNDNPNLTTIKVKNNVDSPFTYDQFPQPPMDAFNFTNVPLLNSVCCDAGELAVMELVLSAQPTVTVSTDCVPAIVNIPDVNFKNKLLTANCASFVDGTPADSFNSPVDTNADGEIQVSEALAVKGLRVNTSIMTTTNDLLSLEGIEYFTNLQYLNCIGNQISALDVTMMPDLFEVNCNYNALTTVDFSGLAQLEVATCRRNNLTTVPLDGLASLRILDLNMNQLPALNVTALSSLEQLYCENNLIASLAINDMSTLNEVQAFNNLLSSVNLSGLTGLQKLGLGNNLFTSFDLSLLTGLQELDISSNAISEIDLDGHTNLNLLYIGNTLVSEIDGSTSGLRYLKCAFNLNLTSINLKNGVISTSDADMLDYAFIISETPLLTSICIDDDQNERYSVAITDYNATGNVTVYTGDGCLTEVLMSTASFDDQQSVMIYPNPAKDRLTIETSNGNIIEAVDIFNNLGQKVIDITNASQTKSVDITGLSTGTYFLKATTQNGQQTQKFIKL